MLDKNHSSHLDIVRDSTDIITTRNMHPVSVWRLGPTTNRPKDVTRKPYKPQFGGADMFYQ
jgi:hypothetical protein